MLNMLNPDVMKVIVGLFMVFSILGGFVLARFWRRKDEKKEKENRKID